MRHAEAPRSSCIKAAGVLHQAAGAAKGRFCHAEAPRSGRRSTPSALTSPRTPQEIPITNCVCCHAEEPRSFVSDSDKCCHAEAPRSGRRSTPSVLTSPRTPREIPTTNCVCCHAEECVSPTKHLCISADIINKPPRSRNLHSRIAEAPPLAPRCTPP